MIKLNNIKKSFRVSRRSGGLKNAAAALFRRDYEIINALDGVSFEIADGEMVGYIGPNGAGKSSTIKVMSGILTPTEGECIINGRVPWKERVNHVREIGVVFGQRSQLWWDVPVIDSFELLRDIYVIPETLYKKNLSRLTDMLDIDKIIKTPARQLSLGQRMRCEIAASLLHSPKILFLDEPTIGLDALSKIAVRDFIHQINRDEGTTVLLTTHDMQDIEALTERILLIGKGKILLDGSLDAMRKKYSTHKTLTVEFASDIILPPLLPNGASLHESGRGHAVIDVSTELVTVGEILRILTELSEIRDISVVDTSIDEIVLHMYNEFFGGGKQI